MNGLLVLVKGPLALLFIVVAVPEFVVSAPKVGRNDAIVRNRGKFVEHSSSFSEKNDLEASEKTWYPVVEVNNDYYDHNDDDSVDAVEYNSMRSVNIEGTIPTTSPLPKSSTKYTTFCEEQVGNCATDDDDNEDDNAKETEQVTISEEMSTPEEVESMQSLGLGSKVSTNKTSNSNSSSGSDVELTHLDASIGSEHTAKYGIVETDLESELDCLIEDVELVLQHAKEFMEDEENKDEHNSNITDSKKSDNSSQLHSSLTLEENVRSKNSGVNRDWKGHSVDSQVDDSVIEDKDLQDSIEETIIKVHKEVVNSGESNEELKKYMDGIMLSPKKLENLIKKERGESNHTSLEHNHHVKEHTIR